MTAPAAIRLPTTDVTDFGNRPGDGPLRVGGQAPPPGMMQEGSALPSTLSPRAQKQQAALTLVRDLQGGTEQLRRKSGDYLPQAPGEDAANYKTRVARSVLFNIFTHTLSVLTGFVFRKDPILGDDVPAPIVAHTENIDLAGSHLAVFLRERLQDALAVGHTAILVEFPKTGGGQSAADEGPDKARPYWVPIAKDNILSWRTTVEDGHTVLTQVVLRESSFVPDGPFGEVLQTRYRVLYRRVQGVTPVVGFVLLEITKDKTVVMVDEGIYGNQVEIPLVEIPSAGRQSLFESMSPLLDLAYLNIAHFQQYSDMATALHTANAPIYVESGTPDVDQDGRPVPLILGPHSARRFRDPAAKAYYISHDGKAIATSQQVLDALVQSMAILGVSMLVTTKRVAETAEAKRIDKGSFDSALAVTARGLQDGAERCLDFHARYMKLADGGSVQINRDFENMSMQAQDLAAYVQAVAQAGLPVRLLLKAMQEGGLIAPDEDLEALEMEMAANQAAADAQKQAEAALAGSGQGDAGGGGAGADGESDTTPATPPKIGSGEGSGPAAKMAA